MCANMKKTVEKVINFQAVSKILTGKPGRITSERVLKGHEKAVKELRLMVQVWLQRYQM